MKFAPKDSPETTNYTYVYEEFTTKSNSDAIVIRPQEPPSPELGFKDVACD
jgi:hypothetical protein